MYTTLFLRLGPDGKGTETIMTKRGYFSIFILLLTCLLASCGQKEEKVRYAIITGTDGGAGDESYSAIISGIETFCGENGYTFQRYSATEDTEEGYAAQFETAANDGARYMIAYGKDMETAVYNAQNDYGKTHFLFFDGEPRKEAGDEESTIKKNTECLTFGKSDIGFLAGYTALRDGSRGVAFISAENSGDTAAYYEGFRQGVAYAENELMLTSSDLSLYAEFCGSTELSPRRLGDALDFYNGGVDLIITDHKGIAEAADRAASAAEKGEIAVLGFDDAHELSHIKFAAVADREAAAKAYLTEIENNEAFVGGIVRELNAGQYAAKISADFTKFIAFGQDSYRSILNAMASVVSQDIVARVRPDASDRGLLRTARISSLVFGLLIIGIALLIPRMGGLVNFIIGLAALTGAPLYMPVLWSLFSRRQTGNALMVTTFLSLALLLLLKFAVFPRVCPGGARTWEMVAGVGVPFLLLSIFEIRGRSPKGL